MNRFLYIAILLLSFSYLACSDKDTDENPSAEIIDPSVIDDVMGMEVEMPDSPTIISRVAIGDTVTTIDNSWNVLVRAYGHMQKGICTYDTMGIYDYSGNVVNQPQLESLDQPFNKTWAITWPPLNDDKRYAKWRYIWYDNATNNHGPGKGRYTVEGHNFYSKGIRYIDIVSIGMAVENNSWHLKFGYNGGEATQAGCSNTEYVFYPWESYVSFKDPLAHDVIIANSKDNDAKLRPVLKVKYKHVMAQLRFILKTDRTDITDDYRFSFHFGYLPMFGIYNYVNDTWRNITCSSGSNYYDGYYEGGLYLTPKNMADAAKMGDTLGVIIIPGDYKNNKLMKYDNNTNWKANGNTNYVINNPTVDNWVPILRPAKKDGATYKNIHSSNNGYMIGDFSGDIYEPGKIYVYNLNYNKDGVYIWPLSVIDWNDSGMEDSMSLQSVDKME